MPRLPNTLNEMSVTQRHAYNIGVKWASDPRSLKELKPMAKSVLAPGTIRLFERGFKVGRGDADPIPAGDVEEEEWEHKGDPSYDYALGDETVDVQPIAHILLDIPRSTSTFPEGVLQTSKRLDVAQRDALDLNEILITEDDFAYHAPEVLKLALEDVVPLGMSEMDAFLFLTEDNGYRDPDRDRFLDAVEGAISDLRVIERGGDLDETVNQMIPYLAQILQSHVRGLTPTQIAPTLPGGLENLDQYLRGLSQLTQYTNGQDIGDMEKYLKLIEVVDLADDEREFEDGPTDKGDTTAVLAENLTFVYEAPYIGGTVGYIPAVSDIREGYPGGIVYAKVGRRPALIYDASRRDWAVSDLDQYILSFPGRWAQRSFMEEEQGFMRGDPVEIYSRGGKAGGRRPFDLAGADHTGEAPTEQEDVTEREVRSLRGQSGAMVEIEGQAYDAPPGTEATMRGMFRTSRPSPIEIFPIGCEIDLAWDGEVLPASIYTRVFLIPEINFGEFEDRFRKMVKKARKLDAPEPEYHVLERLYVDKRTERQLELGQDPVYAIYYRLYVEGDGPKLKGWQFLGKIDLDQATGVVQLKMVPGEEIPEAYRDFKTIDPMYCGHCTRRIRRKHTFLVEHERSGDIVQVGSTCLKDFLGHLSPDEVASYLQFLDDPVDELSDMEDEDFWLGGAGQKALYADLETVLAYTSRSIKQEGWTSRSQAQDPLEGIGAPQATADHVLDMLAPTKSALAQDKQAKFSKIVDESDRELARQALEWSPELWSGSRVSDYALNMRAALEPRIVSAKTIGIVASLVPVYLKAMERRQVEEDRRRAGRDSGFLGEPGEKISVPVTIGNITFHDTMYGVTKLIKMTTDEGDRLAWWYSGEGEFEKGERYNATCTVKKHDTFRGIKETTVSRCGLSPRYRIAVKLTKKQQETMKGLGVLEEERLRSMESRPGMYIFDNLFIVETHGQQDLARTYPEIPKAIKKKVDKALEESDLTIPA